MKTPRPPIIPHSRPAVGPREIAAVVRVLRSRRLATGETVTAYENALARACRAGGAVSTSSGTAALHLALLALGVGRGDAVVIPSYACAAILHAVRHAGATPALADADPETGQMCPVSTRKALSRRTRAIVLPHLFGEPVDPEAFLALGIPLVEDIAQALGASVRGRPAGSFGRVAVMSSYATKLAATGHGGAVLSADRRLLGRVREMLAYDQRDTDGPRFNYRLSDIAAALGLAQIGRLPGFLRKRRTLAALYDALLAGAPFTPVHAAPGGVFYRYVVRCPRPQAGIARRLATAGIEAKPPVFIPLHRLLNLPPRRFPGAEAAHRRFLSLPIYPDLSPAGARRVIRALLDA
ncbi:MAG: DegT/DnrJ/EryC1/StrS family aminotransferase [Planctomycetota bacterium]